VLPVTATPADNVALPGIAMFFKVAEVSECNACSLKIDFMNRRGAALLLGNKPGAHEHERVCDRTLVAVLFLQAAAACSLGKLQARLPSGGNWIYGCGTLRQVRPTCRGAGEVAGRGRAAQRVGLQGARRGLLCIRQEPGHHQGAQQPHAMNVYQPGRAA
jgi:hypothetical protein